MVASLFPFRLEQATVTKRGKTIVGPIDLEITEHGITTILGPNGSGKTTLLRLMHGLERPRKGSVKWNCELGLARQQQAFVFQSPILLRRSALDNIAYPLQLRKLPKTEIQNIAEHWLERVQLSHVAQLDADFLSGGEKQKLTLARALATKPKLLFFDEPTANLDGTATREIEALVKEAASSGVRIIMTTHDIAQGKRLADDILFLYRGLVHESDDADEFFDRPSTEEAKIFLRGDILE